MNRPRAHVATRLTWYLVALAAAVLAVGAIATAWAETGARRDVADAERDARRATTAIASMRAASSEPEAQLDTLGDARAELVATQGELRRQVAANNAASKRVQAQLTAIRAEDAALVRVPELVGMAGANVVTVLDAVDLRFERHTRDYTGACVDVVPTEARVIDQLPKAGTLLAPGATVHVASWAYRSTDTCPAAAVASE